MEFRSESPASTTSVEVVEDVSDFYNQLSLYIQPSITEGFGIEVLEAMAHARPVLCSDGAGARDVVPAAMWFVRGDVADLAGALDTEKSMSGKQPDYLTNLGNSCREWASYYTWDKIRVHYQDLWRSVF